MLTGAAFALIALTSYYYAWFAGWVTLVILAMWPSPLLCTSGGPAARLGAA